MSSATLKPKVHPNPEDHSLSIAAFPESLRPTLEEVDEDGTGKRELVRYCTPLRVYHIYLTPNAQRVMANVLLRPGGNSSSLDLNMNEKHTRRLLVPQPPPFYRIHSGEATSPHNTTKKGGQSGVGCRTRCRTINSRGVEQLSRVPTLFTPFTDDALTPPLPLSLPPRLLTLPRADPQSSWTN